jgi:hypothetical protein
MGVTLLAIGVEIGITEKINKFLSAYIIVCIMRKMNLEKSRKFWEEGGRDFPGLSRVVQKSGISGSGYRKIPPGSRDGIRPYFAWDRVMSNEYEVWAMSNEQTIMFVDRISIDNRKALQRTLSPSLVEWLALVGGNWKF